MARKKPSPKVKSGPKMADVGAQFRDLDMRDPSSWPNWPRWLLLALISLVVLALLWALMLRHQRDELVAAEQQEITLRDQYRFKLAKAVRLDELQKQREQVQQYVQLLEKQLPSKAEMDALLSDVNQAGLGRSLQFELFRPGTQVVKDYYAEQPIDLKVTGHYHDIGAFVSDVAHLSRIVTLNNLKIFDASADNRNSLASGTGELVMEATARTFRYLDEDEIAEQQRAKLEAEAQQ